MAGRGVVEAVSVRCDQGHRHFRTVAQAPLVHIVGVLGALHCELLAGGFGRHGTGGLPGFGRLIVGKCDPGVVDLLRRGEGRGHAQDRTAQR